MENAGKKLLVIAESVVLTAVVIIGFIAGVGRLTFKSNDILKHKDEKSNEKTTTVTEVYSEGRIVFDDDVESAIAAMSTEEKVAQMFLVTPEIYTGNDEVKIAGEGTRTAVQETPVAGVLLGRNNLLDTETTGENVNRMKSFGAERSGYDLLAVADQGAEGNETVSGVSYMTENGLNTILLSSVAGMQDADGYQDAVSASIAEYADAGLLTITPFVPDAVAAGDGATENTVSAYRMGFAKGILRSGAVMVSTGKCAAITGKKTTPVCLSADATRMLRNEMGYGGVLVSGDLSGINGLDISEASVSAVNAGINLLYFSGEYREGYEAVVRAVNEGKIEQMLLDNAVGRILTAKKQLSSSSDSEETPEAPEQPAQNQAAVTNRNRNPRNNGNNTAPAEPVTPILPPAPDPAAPAESEQPAEVEIPTGPEAPTEPEQSVEPTPEGDYAGQ